MPVSKALCLLLPVPVGPGTAAGERVGTARSGSRAKPP